jgi:hypothetical protein
MGHRPEIQEPAGSIVVRSFADPDPDSDLNAVKVSSGNFKRKYDLKSIFMKQKVKQQRFSKL